MEEWTRWEPTQDLSARFVIDALTLSHDGLIVKLSAENSTKKIEIIFDDSLDGHRYTNESFCFKIFSDLSDRYGTEFYRSWSFFIITNSEYVQWLSQKSFGYAGEFSFKHFCIVGDDDILDIVARYQPTVRIIT